MEVPRISKITVNMGVGEAVADKKIMDNAVADLTKITGQKPWSRKARKSVATFKVRDGLRDRLQGHAARRAHVRVPRSPDQHRDAAHPRLPRRDRRARSTAAATTTSASRNRSFSPRSTTTRSTRSAAWTSRSRRRRGRRAGPRAARSVQFPVPQVERYANGQEIDGDATRSARKLAVKQLRGEARRAEGAHPQARSTPARARGAAQASCRSCRATRARSACAIAARSPAGPRGYYRKFGLGRTKLREATMRGDIPGLRKASW